MAHHIIVVGIQATAAVITSCQIFSKIKGKDLENNMFVLNCASLCTTCTEMLPMLQRTYGGDCISQMECYKWFSHFKTDRTSTDEDTRPGQPSMSTIDGNFDAICTMIYENHYFNCLEVAKKVGISTGS